MERLRSMEGTSGSRAEDASLHLEYNRLLHRVEKKRNPLRHEAGGGSFQFRTGHPVRVFTDEVGSELGDVLRGGALLALHHVELNRRALGQALEAVALNGAVVDEAVLRTVLRRDESEALGIVEPLYSPSGTHTVLPVLVLGVIGVRSIRTT
jgi:hypothetical protein